MSREYHDCDEEEFGFPVDQDSEPIQRQPVQSPEIIQNYMFERHFVQLETGIYSSTPVGPASDQCWLFTIEDNRIFKVGNNIPTQSEQIKPGNCAKVTSRTLELAQGGKPGKASWVICCRKDEDGKCKDCTAAVNLQVQVLDGNKPNPIVKPVVLSCIS